MTIISDATIDLKAAEAAARTHETQAGRAMEAEFITLLPVSLIWAHKGLLALYGAAVLLGGMIGHAVR